ncbi:MAG: TIGR03768 family metallophosphoesterase [Bacteroidota bacterium]
MKNNNTRFNLLILVIVVLVMNNSYGQKASYPIATKVVTTVDRTVVPIPVPATAAKISPDKLSEYALNGYGKWQFGSGLKYVKRLDLMPVSYAGTSVTNQAKLLNFFTITDIHITDKESPTQGIFFGIKGGIISAYSGIMLYTTHVLDAAVQTVNALHKKDPLDFGISLGDDCNNSQYNEIRWFIDVLDGKKINPDSGKKDDPIAGPLNDYQDVYQAAGLNKSIPWYQAVGNHDHNWMGTYPPNDYLKKSYVGDSIIKMGKNIFTPAGINERSIYMGVLDGSTVYGDVVGMGPVSSTKPVLIAADKDRRSLSSIEFTNEFFNTSSKPVGHGFNKTDAARGFACYSFEPKANLPLKVIVLDDTQKDGDPSTDIHGHCFLDQERYEWLVKELDKGQSDGKLMIIAAHVPIGINDIDPEMGMALTSFTTEAKFIAKLNTYPNLILWVAGHRHLNTITALKSPDASHPELGFWEVETSSLREFPQQFRTFRIDRNSDNTISIFATDVDPAVKEGSFADISRSYAIGAYEIYKLQQVPSYNAELVKQLTPQMQMKIQKYGTAISK